MHETRVIEIGHERFQIDFRDRSVTFWLLENGSHRRIGNANFVRVKNMAQFSGGITHKSFETILRLAKAAESIFHEKNPGVKIMGHGIWFRPRKPPVGKSHEEIKKLQARPRRQPPKRKPR